MTKFVKGDYVRGIDKFIRGKVFRVNKLVKIKNYTLIDIKECPLTDGEGRYVLQVPRNWLKKIKPEEAVADVL